MSRAKPLVPRNEFRRITIFGAESTGKTTLAEALAKELECDDIHEYARAFLLGRGKDHVLDVKDMNEIWRGQRELQKGRPMFQFYTVQDTDLFSTWGYWNFWQPNTRHLRLLADAFRYASDLYIITPSNIPFEKDPLRYGGDRRESSDDYWIDLCERFTLPYVVLESDDLDKRLDEAGRAIENLPLK